MRHDADWYIAQPVPDRLLRDLAHAPIMSEHEIDAMKYRNARVSQADLSVIDLAAEGYSEKQTALLLGVTDAAVKERLRHARRALGARNTTHAVVLALRDGLL